MIGPGQTALATPAFMAVAPGRPVAPHPTTLGAYQLHEQLGSGGQACVYRARRIADPGAGDVAVKRLHPHLLDDEPSVQAFAREARLAYLLDHPVIRRVLALCRADDELFMVMEYVDGVSLDAILRRAHTTGARLPLAGILTALGHLCRALHYAHALVDERGAPAGLVHRDVTPSNVMITSHGRLKLIDLGVARSQSAEHVTNSGLIKGKYGYMAPEVMQGVAFDGRADVFSAGVVAWELLTSAKLYPVRNPPVDLLRVRARPIVAPSSLASRCPAALDAIVLRALAADPAARWPSCAAMAEALEEVAAQLGEPLADRAVAELADVLATPAPARPALRARFARGTPAEVPTAHTLPTAHLVPVLAAPPAVVTRHRCHRCRRALALGAVGGAAATMLVAFAASLVLGAGDAAVVASAATTADTRVDAAVTVDAAVDAAVRLDAAVDAALPVAVAAPAVRAVTAADVTRLAGPPPRSRGSTARFRATLCIDLAGAVVSVALLEGPARLEDRIARTLLRWRYQPYRDRDGAHPACFEIASQLQKIPRRA